MSAALALLATGCGMGRFAANQLITAPNQRVPASAWAPMWTNFLAATRTNPTTSFAISVGPPAATLQAMHVPPGDYRCRFVTHFVEQTRTFNLMIQPETNATFTPLPEPATIILLHGYGVPKESMAPWAFLLAQSGYRTVAIDLRGHGASTGERIGFGKYEIADLRQALDELIARGVCDERVGVMGLSYGGTLALHWAAADSRVRAVVAIAPYNQPDEAMARFVEMQRLHIPERLLRNAAAATAKKLDLKWSDLSGEAAMRRITQPVLLIGAREDFVSRPADITAMKDATSAPVKTLMVKNANHYIIGYSMEQLAPAIRKWFGEHLGTQIVLNQR